MGTTPVTTSANITPAPLTISGLTASNKQYDGNINAVVTGTPSITGLLGSDTSTLSGSVLSGAFASSNVGTGIGVTANLNSLTLGNGNYYIAGIAFPLAADIIAPPQVINNMAIAAKQTVIPVERTTPNQPTNINKPDVIFVRDSDNPGANLQVITLTPSGALKFPVPDQITQSLIDLSGANESIETNGSTYRLLLIPNGDSIVASLPGGTELPDGVVFNPSDKTFLVKNLSEVTLPLTVKLTLIRNGKAVSEKELVVTK
jgi:hypothetical protein